MSNYQREQYRSAFEDSVIAVLGTIAFICGAFAVVSIGSAISDWIFA